jgi:hypothetical protein
MLHQVYWSAADSVANAPHSEFETRDAAVKFAQQCLGSGSKYVWMAQLGIYHPRQCGKTSREQGWFFTWWSPAAVTGNGGELPESGYGVCVGSQQWRQIRFRAFAEIDLES